MFAKNKAILEAANAAIASGIEDATGKAPCQFKDFAHDYATAFS